MTHTHATAPTQFAEASGVRYAYRRFGAAQGVPLLFLQHFTGTMDVWDPSVVDGFARERPVVLFDNTGVSRSGGATPDNVHIMTDDAATFIGALGAAPVDLLGFSLGGFVAQVLAERYPQLVRRIILAGTGPEGGEGIANLPRVVAEGQQVAPTEPRLFLFFDRRKAAITPVAHSSSGKDVGRPTGTPVAVSRPLQPNSRRSSAGAVLPPHQALFGCNIFHNRCLSQTARTM